MTLAFIDVAPGELTLIVIIAIVTIIFVGNYGKSTALGYKSSVLLCLLASPLVALIVIRILKLRSKILN